MALPTWWQRSFGSRQCRDHARPLPCSAEQDTLQLGRTTKQYCSKQLQHNGSQESDLRALVTPLVTEFGRQNRPSELWTIAATKQEVLAASAGWVAVSLNVVPGLGPGLAVKKVHIGD